MNLYRLSGNLKVDVSLLYNMYMELFPQVKLLDCNVGLTKKEINLLTNKVKKENIISKCQ